MTDNNVPQTEAHANTLEALRYIYPLNYEQYTEACEKARAQAVAQIRPPELPVIEIKTSDYPKWLNWSIGIGIGALLLALFIVSTAKQLEAVDRFVAPVTNSSQPVLRWLVMIALIMGGEIGALLFSIAAGVMPIYKRVFRLFSFAFALVAILANWHVTGLHSAEYQGIAIYAWYLTFLAPAGVIVIGMLVENIAMTDIRIKRQNKEALRIRDEKHLKALHEHQIVIDAIEDHDLYIKRYLPLHLKAALETAHKQNRLILIERPDVAHYAVKQQIARFTFEYKEPEYLPPLTLPKALPRVTPRNADVTEDTQLVTSVTLCAHCHKEPAKERGRFCSDKCRVASHRANALKGA